MQALLYSKKKLYYVTNLQVIGFLVPVKEIDYGCIFHDISKSEAI